MKETIVIFLTSGGLGAMFFSSVPEKGMVLILIASLLAAYEMTFN